MWSGHSTLLKHSPIWKWVFPSPKHTEPDSLRIHNQRPISVLEIRLVYALARLFPKAFDLQISQCGNQCNSYEHECRHQD